MTTIFSEVSNNVSSTFLLFTLALFLIILFVFKSCGKEEGLQNIDPFVLKDSNTMYDDFYVSIYDDLMHCPEQQSFELMSLYKETKPSSSSSILDIGCGTGHHVGTFVKTFQCQVFGLDKSKAMINQCQKTFPDLSLSFIHGDVESYHLPLFEANTFTHIVCFNFTIYEIQNKAMFFNRVLKWLQHGGYFVLHLVNAHEIKSILPLVNDGDKTYQYKTKIDFNDFRYTAVLMNPSLFQEGFAFASGQKRKHEHHLFMESQEYILSLARTSGFIVQKKIHMNVCNRDHHFLYILQKPM
jgi:ubiquinone/menaquinone biosynthesis C-methylase UbiE